MSDDQSKQDPPTYLDMEESSDDGGQAEKPDDNDDKKYIAHDKDQSSDSNRNSKTFESEENLTDESMNKSNDIGQFKQGVNIRKNRKRNKTTIKENLNLHTQPIMLDASFYTSSWTIEIKSTLINCLVLRVVISIISI